MAPKWLFGSIYSFPYYSGGNYSRSLGIELFKVTRDTVIYLGKVCGYKDLDKDGKKEFYIYEVSEFGEGQAGNKYISLPVILRGDSLIYPFIDGGY